MGVARLQIRTCDAHSKRPLRKYHDHQETLTQRQARNTLLVNMIVISIAILVSLTYCVCSKIFRLWRDFQCTEAIVRLTCGSPRSCGATHAML